MASNMEAHAIRFNYLRNKDGLTRRFGYEFMGCFAKQTTVLRARDGSNKVFCGNCMKVGNW